MRRALVVVVALSVGVAVGRLSNQQPVNAQGAGVAEPSLPPCQDINGDGRSDVSDAVYFLNWRFLSGPEPECPDGNGPSTGLPDTGQTLCYDTDGNEIPCDSETCPGQDGYYATGCLMEGRFIDNGDGTVTDICTGLMWQKDTGNDGDTVKWCPALFYCENLNLGGHDDWRLPNIRELHSIVDYGRGYPAIDPVFDASSSFYWSSTSGAKGPDVAWSVDFEGGDVSDGFGGSSQLVRAVRTIQPGE
jgi:hypothetical protein